MSLSRADTSCRFEVMTSGPDVARCAMSAGLENNWQQTVSERRPIPSAWERISFSFL
jgi:hypothetical protein